MKTTPVNAAIVAISMLTSAGVALAQTATANGEVKKIDQSAGKITIRHGPIKAFDMENPMTMVYHVKDPAMLKQVKVGEKVRFQMNHENGVFTVTKIQKAK
ncbi:MAG TPA: copper-binding protein [Pseudolabrys sp.]|nr:copper-binding protein [Pseudolabrys sp.]